MQLIILLQWPHEVAHQWWTSSYRANVQGATMLSESLAEYSSLKVLEHQYPKCEIPKTS
jgi:ABC-2 type transport system permease protein